MGFVNCVALEIVPGSASAGRRRAFGARVAVEPGCGKVFRMGGMYRMQDLLKLVTRERAEELRLEPGRPPIMVLHGKARVMDGGLVTSDDIAELFHSIASDEQNQELTRCGDSHFLFTSEDSGRFKITATANAGQLNLRVMNLTR